MTSDERREVAEQLREARPSTYYAEELVELIEDALLPAFPTETWREPTDVLSALADLIDSTCSMDAIDTGEQADYECREHIMHCKYCGAEFGHVLYSEDGDVSMDDKPNIFPECGARVVRDDQR